MPASRVVSQAMETKQPKHYGTLDNSAAYIAGWLKRLHDDRKLVVKAASAAQKAVDWITGQGGKPSLIGDEQTESEVTQ